MAGLLRYQLFLSAGVVLLSLWRTALAHLAALQTSPALATVASAVGLADPAAAVHVVVTYLPLWVMVWLWLYAFGSVLHLVATLGDCSEAADELVGQIEMAKKKKKLAAAGFAF